MTICIPITFKPHGGGHYFLRAFAAYLTTHGHKVETRLDAPFDVLFTSHWMVPRRDILRAIRRNRNVRIVHRIDGAAADYGRDADADRRQRSVNRLADLTIFQSQYCRWSTREKFPVIAHDGPVIHNPVDLQTFNPDGVREPLTEPARVACVSWSTNPKKGAESIYATAARAPHVGFYLCGQYLDSPALPNLHALGVLDRDRLAVILRSVDALLTYSENEACPNHVIEALASGRPVLYRDSGAMKEVIGDCGVEASPETFTEALAGIQRTWPEWSARARRRANGHFDPELIFTRYVTELERACASPAAVGEGLRYLEALAGMLSPRAWRSES